MSLSSINYNCGLTYKVLEFEVNISELSLAEMREVRSDMRTCIKNIDKLMDDTTASYKRLERLSDDRYMLYRKLGDVEDAIIRKQRNSMNLSSVAFNGGGIYTDISNKGLSVRSGRSAKFSLKGISI